PALERRERLRARPEPRGHGQILVEPHARLFARHVPRSIGHALHRFRVFAHEPAADTIDTSTVRYIDGGRPSRSPVHSSAPISEVPITKLRTAARPARASAR